MEFGKVEFGPKADPGAPYYEKERAAKLDEFTRRIQSTPFGVPQAPKAPEGCSDRTHVQFCPHCGVCHCGKAALQKDQFGPQPG